MTSLWGGVTIKGTANFNRTIFNNIPVFKHGMGWYGWSPITSGEDDTVANWFKAGTNFFYFTGESMTLTFRPEYYGCIFNIVMGDPGYTDVGDINQLWFGFNGLYRRCGNVGRGWDNEGRWYRVTETLMN